MAKKIDKPEETPSNGLTVVTDTPEPIPTAYREVTENRALKVILSQKEREEHTQELARSIGDITNLEEDKKASASRYKAQIEEKQARQNRLSTLIQHGWDERSVKCAWHFETSGKDADGNIIYHPEHKSLIREDTGEVVEVKPMSEADFENKELALLPASSEESDDDETDMD